MLKTEQVVLNKDRNVTLTMHILSTGGEFPERRPAIIVIPGGGYLFCSEREGEPVAAAYLNAGYHVFILHYSLGEHAVWPNPLEDYESAIQWIKTHADQYAVYPDKIAVIGFSAGGHLAACAATMSINRPNAAILGYALTDQIREYHDSAPNVIPFVGRDTCPCFIFGTRNDSAALVSNSIHLMQALFDHEVIFESHIYAYGPHGFSVCDLIAQPRNIPVCERIPQWVKDSIGWLSDIFGDIGMNHMSAPRCRTHISEDDGKYLSVFCSLGCLCGHRSAMKILVPVIREYTKSQASDEELIKKFSNDFGTRMVLRDALLYLNVPERIQDKLEEKLSEMEN